MHVSVGYLFRNCVTSLIFSMKKNGVVNSIWRLSFFLSTWRPCIWKPIQSADTVINAMLLIYMSVVVDSAPATIVKDRIPWCVKYANAVRKGHAYLADYSRLFLFDLLAKSASWLMLRSNDATHSEKGYASSQVLAMEETVCDESRVSSCLHCVSSWVGRLN